MCYGAIQSEGYMKSQIRLNYMTQIFWFFNPHICDGICELFLYKIHSKLNLNGDWDEWENKSSKNQENMETCATGLKKPLISKKAIKIKGKSSKSERSEKEANIKFSQNLNQWDGYQN